MECRQCRRPLQDNFKVCPYCGTEVQSPSLCPACHQKLEPGWVACPFCGYSLQPTPARQGQFPEQPYPNQSHPYPLHGTHHLDSSGKHKRRKGFLGNLFSS